MKRTERAAIAKQTVEITECGEYRSASGETVDIREHVRTCLNGTQLLSPDELAGILHQVQASPAIGEATSLELVNETTLAGIKRLLSANASSVAALNFASAKNPGGGFLGGSQAQEESLARSSALYASLMTAWDYYEQHRSSPSLLYSDAMILSPQCPVFRDDDGALLDKPQLVTFITSAAPNAGAAADNRPEELALIPETFRRRSEFVFALAAAHGYRNLVLGAWGCGVFRNDPRLVATTFVDHLRSPAWRGRFERVLFSVLDSSPEQATYKAFEDALEVGA